MTSSPTSLDSDSLSGPPLPSIRAGDSCDALAEGITHDQERASQDRQLPDPDSCSPPYRLIPLRDALYTSSSDVGNKALSLARLSAQGVRVPDSVIVPDSARTASLDAAGLSATIARLLVRVSQAPAETGNLLFAARRAILGMRVPEQLTSAVHRHLADYGWSDVVVRSSSSAEDTSLDSGAGLFRSVIGARGGDEVVQAMLRVWASVYTEGVNYRRRGDFNLSMAVLIQPRYEGETGVLFTQHPGGRGAAYLEQSSNAEAVTDGRAHRVRRGELTAEDWLSADARDSLTEAAQVAKRLLGGEADVEYAVDSGGDIVILQARRIVTQRSIEINDSRWISQEAVDSLRAFPLGRCDPLQARASVKHVPYRRACATVGVRVYQVQYVLFAEQHREDLHRSVDRLQYEEAVLEWGDGAYTVLSKSDLAEEIWRSRHNNAVPGTNYFCCRVSEVIPAIWTGSSACVALPRSSTQGSLARLTSITDGVLIEGVTPLRPRGDFERRLRDPVKSNSPARLPSEVRLQIAAGTRRLTELLGQVRLEWYHTGTELAVKDLTIESAGPLPSDCDVLSAGPFAGTAVLVTDMSAIEDQELIDQVSVVDHNGVLPEHSGLQKLVDACSATPGGAVIIAPYPATGLIALLDSATGFVFEDGTQLSHMAIAMRERGVPGVVVPDAMRRFRPREFIRMGGA
jgi:hypothetical protein